MLKSLPVINYRIKESDIKLKFSDDPSPIINPSISMFLNKSKKFINKFPNEWDNIKKYTNEYEFIGSVVPGNKFPVSKIKPLSRAFYKLVEIFYSSDIIKNSGNHIRPLGFPRIPSSCHTYP